MKTFSLTADEIQKNWVVVDAADQTLGRLATKVAGLLMGKHKPSYSPHLDMGDHVIVLNASQIKVTGNKLEDKTYWRHTGYMGGIKSQNLATMMERHPERVIELAVRGMLPRNKLSKHVLRHMKVYAGGEHLHEAQVNASKKTQKTPVAAAATAAITSTENES
ncbi:MAG TPA: 50S ribosomal protein L13 [Dehalococcoidia bacterium]|nr:50S ribosomal protein L13 [Dehalococcoidia bacterium]